MNRNIKYLLFERIQHLNPSHKFSLNEESEKNRYKTILGEQENKLFNNISEAFVKYNKLTGNLSEDKKYLKNFVYLMENEDDFDPYAHLRQTKKIDEKKDCLLTISEPNSKLDHPSFALPAGYTCPFASVCKTLTPRDREKINNKLVQDLGDIRCYAASEEARYPNAHRMRWKNIDLLNKFDLNGKVDLIIKSIEYYMQEKGKFNLLRIHESGDFYDMEYFDTWLEVARQRPDILFYAYTKSLPFWIKRMNEIPNNFKLIASVGGKQDELISKHDLKYAVIVNSPEEAKNLRLPIDIDDTMAYKHDGNFAVLLHGPQAAGEKAKTSYKNREIIKNIKKGIY